MRFVVDVQLPYPLVRVFRRNGHDADYATDFVPAVADDAVVWDLAAALGAAIVTKDEDFIDLSARRRDQVSVVWLRCGNVHNSVLYALIERHLAAIVDAIAGGERIIEIR